MSDKKDKQASTELDDDVIKVTDGDEDITIKLPDDSPDDDLNDDLNNSLKERLNEAERQNLELNGMLKRLQAEFDNYRRRAAESGKSAREDGQNQLIEKLLPLLDAFESACQIIKDKSVLQGVELIFKQFESILVGFEVSKIDALGQEFNPQLHNAVLAKDDPKNAGKVIEVIKTGYIRGEKVLRYSFVVVGQ